MTPQQIVLAMSAQLAETTVERDIARQQVDELRARVAELEAKKNAPEEARQSAE